MSELNILFDETLRKHLLEKEYEIVRVVPLPPPNERGSRLEMLVELEEPKQPGTLEYLVQIRPKNPNMKQGPWSTVHPPESQNGQKTVLEGIYLPNGKLNVPYLMKNGELLLEAGDFAHARKIFKTILQSGEMTAPALCRIGKCYEAEGKTEEACAKYEESLAFHPTVECYQRLASIFLKQNKLQQASEVLEKAQLLKENTSAQENGNQRLMPRSLPNKIRNHA